MRKIKQDSQNPKLNLEDLRKLVDDITKSTLAEGKEILYVNEILKELEKRGLNLNKMRFELTEVDKQNIENEIRTLALNCANQALKLLSSTDSVYSEDVDRRLMWRDFSNPFLSISTRRKSKLSKLSSFI